MERADFVVKTRTHEQDRVEDNAQDSMKSLAEERENKEQAIVERLLKTGKLHLGQVTGIEKETGQIRVTCPALSDEEHTATLGSPYLSCQDLLYARERISFVVLDFQTYNGQPVIRDILYSLNDEVKNNRQDLELKKIHIVGDEITLEGRKKVTVKSGDSVTVYEANKGKLTSKARKIRSTATMENKLQGGAVKIN